MRTSLTELQQIDEHVLGTAQPGNKLLFDAKLILNPNLKEEVRLHKQTLGLVKQYGRQDLRTIINNVHQQLFTLPQHQSFRQKIMRLFGKY